VLAEDKNRYHGVLFDRPFPFSGKRKGGISLEEIV